MRKYSFKNQFKHHKDTVRTVMIVIYSLESLTYFYENKTFKNVKCDLKTNSFNTFLNSKKK